jgi:two-component system phosphate regulon sensor histidine kinase PhoR
LTLAVIEACVIVVLAAVTVRAWRRAGRSANAWGRLGASAAGLIQRGRPLVGLGGPDPQLPDDMAFALDELGSRWEREWLVAQEERRRLQSVLAGLQEGIILLDRWGSILVANEAARELWPRLSPRLRGMNQIVLFHDAELDDALSRSKQDTVPRTVEHVRPGPPRRHYEVRILPLPEEQAPVIAHFGGDTPGAAGLLLVIRDVTERRAVEQMRRDFVANVSHELQTPLTSIQGFAETLLEATDLGGADQRRFLQLILGESRRMAALVRDLLELARLEADTWRAEVEPVALEDVATQVVEAARPLAARKGLDLTLEAGPAPTIASRDELARAVENVVANAIAYTPAGGRVSVRTGVRGGEAFAEVADTGPGIPEADLPRIFERFYRVDKGRSRAAGGTGLGLSITRHVMESHGGRVEVSSRLGAGSRFTLVLPQAPATGSPAGRPAAQAET